MPNKLHDLAWIREKTAARWDKLMRAGHLDPHDAARLQAATKASDKAGIQRGLQAFVSPLNRDQLARHETFHEKVTPHVEKYYGVKRPSEDPLNHGSNLYTREGQIYAAPDADRFERILGPLPPSNYRSGLEHEAAEARMYMGRASGYQRRPFGSHHGPAAVIAERLGFQNPDVHAVSDLIREANPHFNDSGNSDMLKKLKRHGMVGNYVMPLGGRAHRSADFDARAKRRRNLAREGKLRINQENADKMVAARKEQLQNLYKNTLPPDALDRLAQEYLKSRIQSGIELFATQSITDPKIFLGTQAGRWTQSGR